MANLCDQTNFYARHRPARFADVYQPHITPVLSAQIRQGTTGCVYLLDGPSGTGKTTLARIFAMALNCEGRGDSLEGGEPCGVCASCVAILSDENKDVIERDCGKEGGVAAAKELIEAALRMYPSRGKFLVFILDEAHLLTNPAQSSLFKVMEQPPPYVRFVLCTTDVQKINKAIRTRAQKFHCRNVPLEPLRSIVQGVVQTERIEAEDAAIDLICRSAQGSPRDALVLLQQLAPAGVTEELVRETLGHAPRQIAVRLIGAIGDRDAGAAWHQIEAATAEGRDLAHLLQEAASLLCESLRERVSGEASSDRDVRRLRKLFQNDDLLVAANALIALSQKARTAAAAELVTPVGVLTLIDTLARSRSTASG